MFKKENKKAKRRANVFIFLFCLLWLVSSYYFILQPGYVTPEQGMYEENTPFVADKENSYLEEQEDGSYIFYYAGFTDRVSREDVEKGLYNCYPIIKYEKDNSD